MTRIVGSGPSETPGVSNVGPPLVALPRSFFERDVLDVATGLLGSVLRRRDSRGVVALRITEVEAYGGGDDPGSHAFRGPTPGNRTMFGPPGHLYCYFTYGLHYAVNVVVGETGHAAACLVRAGAIVEGELRARQRRTAKARTTDLLDRSLGRGPGCVAQCFDVNLENDGDDLLSGSWEMLGTTASTVGEWRCGPRVGVSGLGGHPDFSWRFWLEKEPSVSAYRAGRGTTVTRDIASPGPHGAPECKLQW